MCCVLKVADKVGDWSQHHDDSWSQHHDRDRAYHRRSRQLLHQVRSALLQTEIKFIE